MDVDIENAVEWGEALKETDLKAVDDEKVIAKSTGSRKVSKRKAATKSKTSDKKKPKKKAKKLSDGEAKETIFQYLKSQNRPHNSTKIFENLNKRFSQKQVKTVLDSLVKECKVSNKGNVFWIDQEMMKLEVLTGVKEEEVDELLEKEKLRKENLEEELRKKYEELALIKQEPSNEDLKALLQTETARADALKDQLNGLDANKENSSLVACERTVPELQAELKFLLKCWKSLKQNVVEVLNGISEGKGVKVAELVEEIGIDCDDPKWGMKKTPKSYEQMIS